MDARRVKLLALRFSTSWSEWWRKCTSPTYEALPSGQRMGQGYRRRDKPPGRSCGFKCLVAAAAFVLVVTVFLWRISDVDPTSCSADHGEDIEKFTIVLNTFKRPDRLAKSIPHYAKCSLVDAIRIVWSESPDPPTHLGTGAAVPVVFDVHTKNSLNNRFVPIDGIKTEGVFNVDDDMLVDCASLHFGFQVWRTSRDTLVGYNARIHSREGGEGDCSYGYKHWWHVWWGGQYSIVLTKAAFCHHKWFAEYSERMIRDIWQYAHEHRNCEDIAMQFLVSNSTGLPPVWVKGSYSDSGVLDFKGGVSTGSGHAQKRNDCISQFARWYGKMPLKTTSVAATPLYSWSPFRTPPAIWEWLHPI